MEILQTIWNVLITENERLANIIICPFIFIEAYLYMMVFILLLNIKTNKKQRISYFVSFAIIAIINILFIPYPYYTFVNVLACPVLVFIIFKQNILISILCEITMYLVSILLTTPLMLIYTYVLKIPSSLITAIPLHRLIYSMLFYILIILFCYICKKSNFSFSSFVKLKNKFSPFLLLNFIVGTLAIAIQCYLQFYYIDYIPLHFIIINISILLIYFFISLFSLARTSKLESTTESLEEQKLYNHTLTLLYDKIRIYKHDFNNTIQGIGGYLSTNNMDGLKQYYTEILDDCQKTNSLSLLSPEVINNPAIYSLLTAKYHEATELGIKVTLDIFLDLSTINMKIYDLTRTLGILIDNAIDAAKQCDKKEIIINFRKDNKRHKQLFIIQNTYSNKDVNIDEIFEKGKSSKQTGDPKSHGLGLWEVRQLIKKNRNLDLYTTKSEKYFKQQFEIYC